MVQANDFSDNRNARIPLSTRMLIGAAIGLAIISFFVFGADNPNPEWGKFWMVRPLVVVPIAGAMAGLFHFFMNKLHRFGGWKKAAAIVVTVLAYVIGLWLGIIVGLDGTMWN